MLRLLVLALLLANAAYFAWAQGLLAAWGAAPVQQSEPQRLGQQVKPEAIRLLGAEEARRIETSAVARPPECLQAGPLDEGQTGNLRQALESWPAGSWALEPATEPARWIVYMGKYLTADNVNRKKSELRQMSVSFEPLLNASLEPGLSLGGYPTQSAAQQQLEALAQRGVRTAKVVLERPEVHGTQLKLPAVDDTLRPRLEDLKAILAAKGLRVCRA